MDAWGADLRRSGVETYSTVQMPKSSYQTVTFPGGSTGQGAQAVKGLPYTLSRP